MSNELVLNNENTLPSKVELTKNTKGYTWTISVRCKDGEELKLIDKMGELNSQMLNKFKSE